MQQKNVQIPLDIFMAICHIFSEINSSDFSVDLQSTFKKVIPVLEAKKNSIRNRQAYGQIVQASTQEEKQLAFENYRNTRELFR